VTKPRKSQDLPRTISQLGAILSDKQGLPTSIQPVLDAIKIGSTPDPANDRLKAFDKKIQHLAKTNPSSLADLADWLKQPQSQEMLQKAGGPNLAAIWLQGLEKIKGGAKATATFGSRGKPHTWTFSESQIKALKTEDLRRQGMILQDAITAVYGSELIDDREIRRTRSRLEVKRAATDILPLLSQPRSKETK
jgi:hypothetical protein